ncbi:hypothetical protein QTJ16_001817 [Diplocarpon rosae]|uniref:O-methyltransferase n=1 Tax=Diplocarpon rosae TaxID=946125 RepID=A0AAD9WGW2_9HELO|nr:hypothetical protein QTJ16_001817 [Diplocarpon rosae]
MPEYTERLARTPPGFPAFEPALLSLTSISTTIQASIIEYEHAKSPEGRAIALKRIQVSSAKLSVATTPIQQQFLEINFRPNLNVAIRIALEMDLFTALPASGEASTVADLASATDSEPEFLHRIARTLAAFSVIRESFNPSSLPAYSHAPYSRFLTLPPAQAATRHFDDMLHAQVNSAVGYYLKHGFKNPVDAKNSPFTFAHGEVDKGIFDILEANPRSMALFNSAMAVQATAGMREVAQAYPFDELVPNTEGVVLVDVGGGKGQVLNEIRAVYPELKGSLALEDMKVVLDGGVIVSSEVKLQPYDFFKEQQPIRGGSLPFPFSPPQDHQANETGSNYILKSILHDWPDTSCHTILRNLAPAFRSSPSSRLLICELILPDRNPSIGHVLRDINMLVIGGKERSKAQWSRLLGEAGYSIVGWYGVENASCGIIEAVLDE